MHTFITPRRGDNDLRWNRSQLLPVEVKSGPTYVKQRVKFTFKVQKVFVFLILLTTDFSALPIVGPCSNADDLLFC